MISERVSMSDGFGLLVRRWSPGARPARTLVALHGIEAHSGYFDFLGQFLAGFGTEVVAFDRRGSGQSVDAGHPRGLAADPRRQLEDVREILRQARVRQGEGTVGLLGHSLGGFFALAQAAADPTSVDKLVLASVPVSNGVRPSPAELLRIIFRAIIRRDAMYDVIGKWPPRFLHSEDYLVIQADSLSTGIFGARWLLQVNRWMISPWARNAKRVQAPTLILQGTDDPISLPDGAARLSARIGSEMKMVRTLDGGNHHLFRTIFPAPPESLERATAVATWVKDWVEGHPTAASA